MFVPLCEMPTMHDTSRRAITPDADLEAPRRRTARDLMTPSRTDNAKRGVACMGARDKALGAVPPPAGGRHERPC